VSGEYYVSIDRYFQCTIYVTYIDTRVTEYTHMVLTPVLQQKYALNTYPYATGGLEFGMFPKA
jgi:hypothetical protein